MFRNASNSPPSAATTLRVAELRRFWPLVADSVRRRRLATTVGVEDKLTLGLSRELTQRPLGQSLGEDTAQGAASS